jgi:hypothetical protein
MLLHHNTANELRKTGLMNEQEWLSTGEWWNLLEYMEGREGLQKGFRVILGRASDRKWRLFACASVSTIFNMITANFSREIVHVAEQYADGLVSDEQLLQIAELAEKQAWPNPVGVSPSTADYIASKLAITEEGSDCSFRACWVNAMVLELLGTSAEYELFDLKGYEIEEYQLILIRDIFGNPFRRVPLDPSWQLPEVLELATRIYETRRFEELPVLADALEMAGCTDESVLSHCRRLVPHVKGCWVLDWLLRLDPGK